MSRRTRDGGYESTGDAEDLEPPPDGPGPGGARETKRPDRDRAKHQAGHDRQIKSPRRDR